MGTTNTTITFKGSPTKVEGRCLKVGDTLPQFKLTGTGMEDITNETFKGKTLVLSVVPSLDTPVCQEQTKKFNQEATKFGDNAVILTVSLDLPFAQKRWCGLEGVTNVVTASDYKYRKFGQDFGVYLTDLGLLTRAVFVADRNGKVTFVDYVNDVATEPDYVCITEAIEHAIG